MFRTVILFAALATLASANADEKMPELPPYSDADFLGMAASGDMLEARLGAIAPSRSKNDAVKSLAKEMAADHAKCYVELQKLAEKNGITLPKKLVRDHQSCIDKFVSKGADFDRLFLDENVRGHEMGISVFKRAVSETKNEDIRQYAIKGLAMLQRHADKVKKLRGT